MIALPQPYAELSAYLESKLQLQLQPVPMAYVLEAPQDIPHAQAGRFAVTNREEDQGAFKTPTLRDIVQTAPYFHDGRARTMEEVVEFYDQGGIDNPTLSAHIKPLSLIDQEKADLVEFMRALTGQIDVDVMAPQLPK